MEEIARAEFKIRTLQKHQEIIGTLGGKTVPAEIQGIKIGECVLIAAPMEVLTEVGLKVKKTSPFRHTYIASIANGYLHYSPPASYYPLGSYGGHRMSAGPGLGSDLLPGRSGHTQPITGNLICS